MSVNSPAKIILQRIVRVIILVTWVLFGLALMLFLAGVVIAQLPGAVRAGLVDSVIAQLLVSAIMYVGTLVIVVGLPYWLFRHDHEQGRLFELLGLRKRFRWRHLGIFGLSVLGYVAGTLLLTGLATLIPGFEANQEQNVGFQNMSGTRDLILAFIALVVLPPLIEELLFRGYLFGKLRQQHGFWMSAIITSVVFGAVHLQWNVGLDTFVLSVFLCILREKTGAIWMSVLLHALKNGVAYFFLFIAPLLGINLI